MTRLDVHVLGFLVFGLCLVFAQKPKKQDFLSWISRNNDKNMKNYEDTYEETYDEEDAKYKKLKDDSIYVTPDQWQERKRLYAGNSPNQLDYGITVGASNWTYWWNGPNVCVDREEAIEYDSSIERKSQDESTADFVKRCYNTESSSNCWEVFDKYECTTKTKTRGITKTYTTIYKCCYGFKRAKSSPGCRRIELKTLIETIRDIEASEFLNMMMNERLTTKIKTNSTLFIPYDDAIYKFAENSQATNFPINPRTKRSIGMAFSTKDIILNHMLPLVVDIVAIEDNDVFKSYLRGGIMRLNVFPTSAGSRLITVNCVAVRKASIYSINGLIHIVDGIVPPATASVKEIVVRSSKVKIFKRILRHDNVARALDRKGPFTFLLPTDDAFRRLPNETRSILLSGSDCALAILRNHIIPRILCSTSINGEINVKNELGTGIRFDKKDDDKLYVDDKYEIVKTDIMATNGIIHVIDGFLLPDSGLHIMQILERYNFTRFIALLQSFGGLPQKWNTYGNKTFFIPTNKAFSNGVLEHLEEIVDDDSYITLLDYYMSPRLINSWQFLNNMQVETELEEPGRINLYSTIDFFNQSKIHINRATYSCAQISNPDIDCCGNIVHAIDKIVLPPTKTIFEFIATDLQFVILRQILKGSDIERILKNESLSITFLAPTDAALAQLNDKDIEILMTDKEKTTEVLANHILKDVLCCAGIGSTPWDYHNFVHTWSGQPKEITRNVRHQVRIGTSTVTECDIMASNGVIHHVNKILLPVKRGFQFNDLGLFVFDI